VRRNGGGVNSEIPWTAIVLVRSNLWPNYYLPFLVRAGHLKPLGKPAQNARKWFATVEIERMSCDPDWLDKAIRIVEKQIQEMNRKQRGKEQLETPLVR
jgi:hypothetical protein